MGKQCLTVSDKRKIPTRPNCPMHGVWKVNPQPGVKLLNHYVVRKPQHSKLQFHLHHEAEGGSHHCHCILHIIRLCYVTIFNFNGLAIIWWIWRSPSVISFMTFADMIKIQSMTFLMDKIIGVGVLWNWKTLMLMDRNTFKWESVHIYFWQFTVSISLLQNII